MSSTPVPDYAQSIAFLTAFRPTGFWILTAIRVDELVDPETTTWLDSDRKTETRPFSVTEVTETVSWLEKKGRDSNLYFSVNPTITPVHKKAERADIAELAWLHVDIDPNKGVDFEQERRRIGALLHEFLPVGVPQPTLVIDSGGGGWGLWRLTDPLLINGDSAKYEEAKRYNLQLEMLFGADGCSNVDRIARLPGTVNWPNEKKKARGQVPAVAQWGKVASERSYDRARFTPAPLVQSEGLGGAGLTVHVSGNIRRLSSVEELPKEVSRLCKVVINLGVDPDNPQRWSSRSEPLFWVCCELARAGCDDDTIYSVITDPDFRISESVIEKGSRAEKYALRQIERAREEAIDPDLRRLNEKHAVIGDIGGKCRILSEVYDETLERTMMTFQSFQDFHNRYCNQMKEVGNADALVSIALGQWWTRHPNRRSFERIVFSPGGDIEHCYNLWRGFGCEAKPGVCSRFLAHVHDNICSGDEEIYTYLLEWMATAVQRPGEQGHVAIVMRGERGVGKGVFATNFGKLFGRHFLPVTQSSQLVGQFNGHLRDCVTLFADEAFYAGDKRHEAMLKIIVTEDTLMSEKKGVDAEPARNYIHLIMAANESWVVPAGANERRYLVLDVSDNKLQNLDYFGAVKAEYVSGGKEALLHFLMNYPLGKVDIRNVPKTAALQEQKQYSMSREEEWWYSILQRGEINEGYPWPKYVPLTQVAHDFMAYGKGWHSTGHGNSTRLGMLMKKFLPHNGKWVHRLTGTIEVMDMDGELRHVNRPRVYVLDTLEACRAHFAKKCIGGEVDWIQPDDIPLEPTKEEQF